MLFLAYAQWTMAPCQSKFALSKTSGMQTKQTITVIGATGNMGSAIAKSLAKGNYRLLLCADNQDKVNSLIDKIKEKNAVADIEYINCSVNGSWEADIIITAVPYSTEKEVA